MYLNERGGRPNLDERMMVKLLVVQQWSGLLGQKMEGKVTGRKSFQRFLSVPEKALDYSMIWLFRERASQKG